MTPTLLGRWQTRIFLLATVGFLVSLPFGQLSAFLVLFYIGLFGLAWDVLYNFLQTILWDHDWPGVFQFLAAIVEAIWLILVINIIGLPFLGSGSFDLGIFIRHYTVVSIATYLFSWVVMRLLFPRWRFRGGEWLGKWLSTP
ncbi:hypothetical protein [Gloeocapsa sp. PCC 73106]|uniref:hypothetical protein n=1 Tax=Gloeocapsa sp. PCC 73106 TaxID=102232 RepID=UPI0002ACC9BD|nr:hypothetical protein [Gloeocapsa sp. PCC 73106]ELR99599.1 hypothetical protein GLO73106DRAFT_00034510 [Gloeocapsa sp. PCC 73106]